MPFTALVDTSERLRQYREALDFYLHHTSLPIVFCENTLCDFSGDYRCYLDEGRLEYITFDGNTFDKSKGKGYGEAMIMEEALNRSLFLAECCGKGYGEADSEKHCHADKRQQQDADTNHTDLLSQ